MADPLFLSVVIPAHNEEKRLPTTLARIQRFLEQENLRAEVIVVENGSRDRTAEVTREASGHFPELRLVQVGPRGKGRAVQVGMLAAQGAYRFQCDADLSMPIDEVVHFLPPRLADVDVAIASREAKGARRIGEPAYRHAMGRVFAFLVKRAVLPGFEDTQCGFKCYRAPAAEEIFRRQRLTGWTFDVEDLFLALKLGYVVREVPISWQYSPESRVHMVRDSAQMVIDLFRIRWNWKREAYALPGPANLPHPQA
ncbi:MAG: glycosyltransferase [Anaerolineales bacterium]|jgi:glycosyltransferase involved in cell wall biosynthesis